MVVSYMSPSRGAKKAIAFFISRKYSKASKNSKICHTELFSIVPKAHYDNAAADAERILKRWWHGPIVSFIDTRDTQWGKSRSHYFCHQIHIFLRRDSGKNGFSFSVLLHAATSSFFVPISEALLKDLDRRRSSQKAYPAMATNSSFPVFSGKNISFYVIIAIHKSQM